MKPLIKALITAIIPFSQIFIRIFALDGSLNKPWLLIPIFLIPPLSLIPAFFMYFNLIEPGQGGKPIDWYMLIPIITGIIVTIITKKFNINPVLSFILRIIIPMIASIIGYYIRDTINCKKKENKSAPIIKTLFNGVAVQSTTTLANFFLQGILPFIPIIGIIVSIIQNMPYVGQLFEYVTYILFYVMIYAIINMINGIDSANYCSTSGESSKTDKIRIISAVIGLVMVIILALIGRI
jgi:phage-related holin